MNEIWLAAAEPHPVLDPEKLAWSTEAAARDLVRQGQSENTRTAYQGAMRYWGAWFVARFGRAFGLPMRVEVVIQFIVDHAAREPSEADFAALPTRRAREKARAGAALVYDLPASIDQALVAQGVKKKLGPYAQNTLIHRLAVLSKAHQSAQLDNPCNHPAVREMLRSVRAANAKRGVQPRKQAALTQEPLEAILATCDDSPLGLRDRALLLFAWASGGRRRSEVAGAMMENLRKDGARGYIFKLSRSKTNQEGADDLLGDKPVGGRAAAALDAWLQWSKITEGPVFRRVLSHGVGNEPLDPTAIRKIVKRRCLQAGLEGEFSAHSLRSGFVTEAGRRKVDIADAMAMTGHRNHSTFMGYYRARDPLARPASSMLDDAPASGTQAPEPNSNHARRAVAGEPKPQGDWGAQGQGSGDKTG
jgi:integrase